ncbi:hypothetical protein HNV12_03480 [Methanococcoides sp. SA1]|nr:hypothetical protein [Methanococcoides sp. SA1]
MSSLFNIPDPVVELVENLEDDLKGVLRCIAHTDDWDLSFARGRIKELDEMYSVKLEKYYHVLSSLGFAGDFINEAYQSFADIIDEFGNYPSLNDRDREKIAGRCENVLAEWLELSLDGFSLEERTKMTDSWI